MADNKNTTWSLVKRWGEECFKHSNCTPLGSRTPFVPRHLINVGDDSWEQVKLQQSSEVMKSAQYMTLSHRWGEDVPGTLTTKNLEELSCMIPTTFLSATFKDAIIVTRCLGFKYLWVDSLCIIQDSLEDWATESALSTQSTVMARTTSQLSLHQTPRPVYSWTNQHTLPFGSVCIQREWKRPTFSGWLIPGTNL